jgi:DNA repair protein RAD50
MAIANELNNKIQRKEGEQSQIQQKLSDIQRDMTNPKYADAKKNYVELLVERTVTAGAIEDLTKYWKVLDEAIIKFHEQKMAQINSILQELWVRVYQGNDIESIKIK